MLGLTINKVDVTVITTESKVFFVSIPLYDGLNIIRAENSSGKSTVINSIAYGLGLESILGPSRKRPFPKSLYEVIYDNKTEENPVPYYVHRSFVSISITNNHGNEATLTRDILGQDNKVSIVTEGTRDDYFLGSSGKVGSAVSGRGFHNWLAKFLDWSLPNVVSFDDEEKKLYLECIFPLFFIEQKRGWSEIQANTPTNYGIKNVKKAAAEFCLGIDTFEHEKKIAKLKRTMSAAESEWGSIISFVYSIAEFNDVSVNDIGNIDAKELLPKVVFSYLESGVSISVNDQEKALNRLIENLSSKVIDTTPKNEGLSSKLADLRFHQRKVESCLRDIESTMLSISDADTKLIKLSYDYDQYQQLKRLKNVGGEITEHLITEKCPICESELPDTLGSSKSVKRSLMSLDENIAFLKNQIDFFTAIKGKSENVAQDLYAKLKLLRARVKAETENVEILKAELQDVNGPIRSILRQKMQAEQLLKEVKKLKNTQEKINQRLDTAHLSWSTSADSLKLLRKSPEISSAELLILNLQKLIRGDLKSFGANPSAINSISISPQTLRPEQEGYDIVAETSASDYIRIIWAYTLSLMELAATEDTVKHGGFVVFDEPRQHEASKVSFISLITKAASTSKFGGQVIFATSIDEAELNDACKGKQVNIVSFNDYVLTLQNQE